MDCKNWYILPMENSARGSGGWLVRSGRKLFLGMKETNSAKHNFFFLLVIRIVIGLEAIL
ncbi:hypothetical protein BDQ94DRAFT_153150 [Aspergillus welwitschiae]|uniref:Uncharacterized protein n=1 Tax=Aspergillus welwitschiae TaxID=1341132 RepID=A0A3F3PM09_9EURO|nr:hypothetical protein BDQ94DRAFT_153150 [Aspergillus welwitschiae]RDH27812.1 hypothetical protein BDQ94DRAFT_153150 [Aspergillus welwitschiae]